MIEKATRKKRIIQSSVALTMIALLVCAAIFIPKIAQSATGQTSHKPVERKINYLMMPTLSVQDFVGTSDLLITAKIDVLSSKKIKAPFKTPNNIDNNALYDADLFTVKLTKVYKGHAVDGDTLQIIRFLDSVENQQEGAKLLAVGKKGYASICVFKDDEYPQIDGTNGFLPIENNGDLSVEATRNALMFRNNQLHVQKDKNAESNETNGSDKIFTQETFEKAILQIVNKNNGV